jgi:hypothetical protein
MTRERIVDLFSTLGVGILSAGIAGWYGHNEAVNARQQAEWVANQNHDVTVQAQQKLQDMVDNDHGFIMDQETRLLKIDNSLSFIYGKLGWSNMSSANERSGTARKSAEARIESQAKEIDP